MAALPPKGNSFTYMSSHALPCVGAVTQLCSESIQLNGPAKNQPYENVSFQWNQ